MAKFSDSNYDILDEYFDAVAGGGVGLGDSWLLGPKKGVIGDGGVAEILWEDNPQRGFVAHRFIIQDIEGNSFNMSYDGLVSTHSLASSAFEVGNDFYFRKDSFFYAYLAEQNPEFRDYINQERTFCYFGKIWPISNRPSVWNIEFYGMKDYMQSAIPAHNRTPRLVEMMDTWFDQINHEPYNMTKYLWALLDAKEVDLRWLDYIASQYGIDVNLDINELTLREWVDLLVYFLKRIGTYNAIYIVYKVFTALSENKLNVYERWEEWCQRGAGDMPSFKEFPNFFPGTKDFHWFEYYNIPASGGAGDVWYSQFNPSGTPTPNPYSINWDAYPTHALSEPLPSCSMVSASPTGSMIISPHYIVEIDLTSEPIGDKFDADWILNQFYADELIRNWEYARPVNKYVQYQHLIAPACAQSRSGEPENLYPLTSLGYFNTTFTASQYLSGAAPTPSGGEVAYVYTQYGGSANWTITHGLSSSHIIVQAWAPVSGPSFLPMVRVIPNEVEILDSNTVYLSFDDPIAGIANIAGYIPNISHEYDQVAPTNPWSVIHNLGTTAPSGYPTGSLVNYYTSPNKSYPDTVEIINTNRTNATWDSAQTGIAFTRNADYAHTQTVASTTWNINHQMNTDGTIIQCYDSSNQLIEPITTILTNANNTEVTFETAQSGTAYLIYFKRDVISRLDDSCDITGTGICPDGLGYWKVGDGGIEDYDPYVSNDLESPTASGDYWRVWSDVENYYIDFIVPAGEDLTIREVGLFNVDDVLIYYSVCSELYKPEEVQTVFHYRSQSLFFNESSSSSSSSVSTSSSSSSSSESSSSSSESSSSSSSRSSTSSSSSQSAFCYFDIDQTFDYGENYDPLDPDAWETPAGWEPMYIYHPTVIDSVFDSLNVAEVTINGLESGGEGGARSRYYLSGDFILEATSDFAADIDVGGTAKYNHRLYIRGGGHAAFIGIATNVGPLEVFSSIDGFTKQQSVSSNQVRQWRIVRRSTSTTTGVIEVWFRWYEDPYDWYLHDSSTVGYFNDDVQIELYSQNFQVSDTDAVRGRWTDIFVSEFDGFICPERASISSSSTSVACTNEDFCDSTYCPPSACTKQFIVTQDESFRVGGDLEILPTPICALHHRWHNPLIIGYDSESIMQSVYRFRGDFEIEIEFEVDFANYDGLQSPLSGPDNEIMYTCGLRIVDDASPNNDIWGPYIAYGWRDYYTWGDVWPSINASDGSSLLIGETSTTGAGQWTNEGKFKMQRRDGRVKVWYWSEENSDWIWGFGAFPHPPNTDGLELEPYDSLIADAIVELFWETPYERDQRSYIYSVTVNEGWILDCPQSSSSSSSSSSVSSSSSSVSSSSSSSSSVSSSSESSSSSSTSSGSSSSSSSSVSSSSESSSSSSTPLVWATAATGGPIVAQLAGGPKTLRQSIEDAAMPDVSGTAIRVTLGHQVNYTVFEMWIGERTAATNYVDFAVSPTQITFDGGSASVAVSASGVVSDVIAFSFDGSKDYLISSYESVANVGLANNFRYFYSVSNGVNEASVMDVTPGPNPGQYAGIVNNRNSSVILLEYAT